MANSLSKYESYKNHEEYDSDNSVSYSMIKDIPHVFFSEEQERKQSKAMDFGALVDVILLDPEQLLETFYVGNFPPTSENLQNIAKILVNTFNIKEPLSEEYAEHILLAAKKVGYGQSYKTDTLVNKVIEGCKDYHQKLVESKGKTVVMEEEYALAAKAVSVLLKSFWSRPLIIAEESHIETLYHYRINYKLEGVACKSELDIVRIDNKEKVIRPIDIKVGAQSFMRSFYQFKWYLQGALYREGLETFIKGIPEYENYHIDPFTFIHLNLNHCRYPTIRIMSVNWHVNALIGWREANGNEVKGILDLLTEVQYYRRLLEEDPDNELLPMELVASDGRVIIPVPDVIPF